jgi:hypothetical protein
LQLGEPLGILRSRLVDAIAPRVGHAQCLDRETDKLVVKHLLDDPGPIENRDAGACVASQLVL